MVFTDGASIAVFYMGAGGLKTDRFSYLSKHCAN